MKQLIMWILFGFQFKHSNYNKKNICETKPKKKKNIKGDSGESSEKKWRAIDKNSVTLENTYIIMNRCWFKYEH